METLNLFLYFVFGTIIGSFLNVVILRLPSEETLQGRSHCPKCGRELTASDLVPILSFLFLRGKCRSCGKKISVRYPVIEATVGMLFALGGFYVMPGSVVEYIELIRLWFIISVLVVVFVVDLEHFLILDRVVFPASIALLVLHLALDFLTGGFSKGFGGYAVSGLLGTLCTGGTLFLIWWVSKGKWIGFGDVKFMLFFGQALGFPLAVVGFFLSFMLGSLIAVPLLVLGKKGMKSKLPLGAFLTPGLLITYLFGEKILSWYLHLIWYT